MLRTLEVNALFVFGLPVFVNPISDLNSFDLLFPHSYGLSYYLTRLYEVFNLLVSLLLGGPNCFVILFKCQIFRWPAKHLSRCAIIYQPLLATYILINCQNTSSNSLACVLRIRHLFPVAGVVDFVTCTLKQY